MSIVYIQPKLVAIEGKRLHMPHLRWRHAFFVW